MKHEIKKLSGSQVELTVTLEDQEFSGYYQAAEDQVASEVTIKGFRKGAAPKELVAQALDHDQIFHSAVNEAVSKQSSARPKSRRRRSSVPRTNQKSGIS